MKLKDILGQERSLRRITALLKGRRIPPALLFHGPQGVGKTSAAFAFAQSLNCTKNTTEACGACPSCVSADKGIDPDLHRVNAAYQAGLLGEEEAKQKTIKIDTVRHLIGDIEMRSGQGRYKTILLENAHRLAPAAANAMLKSLEEPPPYTVWILITHRPNELLGTIRSRCQDVPFSALTPDILFSILKDRGVAEDRAKNTARLAEGSLTRAAALQDDPLPDPSAWLKDPLGPITLSESLPRELHLARQCAGDHLRQMSWYIRSTHGVEGYRSPAVRTVQRELADMHRALSANADSRLVVLLSAVRLQQLDAALTPAKA